MMKNYFKSIALMLLFCLGFQAKAVITVSFSSTSTLDSVKVENLTRNTSTMLKSSFSVNLENLTAGIQNPNVNSADGTSNTVVYPNPFNNQVNVEYYATTAQKVNVSVYDIAGRVVSEYIQQMEQGVHKLHFKPNTAGLYLIKVADKTGSSASKVYCLQSSSSTPKLEYEGEINTKTQPAHVKSSTETDTLIPGDMLRFTGYSGSNITTLYDVARVSGSYNFAFAARNFTFKSYYTQTAKPCLVDLMFAVTDANSNKGVDYLNNSDFVVTEDDAISSPTSTFRYVQKIDRIPATIKTVLLLNNSAGIGTDLPAIKAAALAFVQSMYQQQQVAIYSFADSPVLLQDYTTDKTLLTNAINGISLGVAEVDLYGAAILGATHWNDAYSYSGLVQGSAIIFTKSNDTQGSSSLNSAISSRTNKKVYVIGLGSSLDATLLNQVANPSPYYPIATAADLQTAFAAIQSDIVQFSNSFYWINYMTKKRIGSHTLKLEVANNTNSGSTNSLNSSFDGTSFSNVTAGVYVNKADTRLYGLDTIRCFATASGSFTFYDKSVTNTLGATSLVLTPITYGATAVPLYIWANSKSTACSLTTSIYSNATLLPLVTHSDTSVIAINDNANNFTRNVVLIICPMLAELNTNSIKDLTSNSVTLGGVITNLGKTAVTARGVCYSTSTSPTISNSKVMIGSGKGNFEASVTGLSKVTTYYARAYATNSAGTSYGNEISFTTLADLPSISATSAVSAIYSTIATCGGNVSSAEGAMVTARGVCWSTTSNPTIADSKTSDGAGTGVFTSAITGLVNGTTYYVRAYATNAVGTNYGTEVSFTTLSSAPTSTVTNITSSTASCGGEAISSGGSTVTARGVCWSTSEHPTINNSKTIDGIGTGLFISTLTGLVNGTTYYARAYATNAIGTNYGTEVSFTTLCSVTTSAVSQTGVATASCGGEAISAGGSTVIARGVCWSYAPNPTISDSKTTDGAGTGIFVSNIDGRETIYIKAYVTNATGTSYGNQIIFTFILPTIPVFP